MSTQANTEEITLTEAILAITVKDAEVVVE